MEKEETAGTEAEKEAAEETAGTEATELTLEERFAIVEQQINILINLEKEKSNLREIIIKPEDTLTILIDRPKKEMKKKLSMKDKIGLCCNCVDNNIDFSPRLSLT